MNPLFSTHVDRAPILFASLTQSPKLPVRKSGLGRKKGIYIFYEGDTAVHVGRTRNIRQRLTAHCTANHNSASFAFKRARRELNQITTYNVTTSRAMLQKDEIFGPCFQRHVQAVAEMEVQFVEVVDPIDQYLLELYVALELNLPTDEFDTH